MAQIGVEVGSAGTVNIRIVDGAPPDSLYEIPLDLAKAILAQFQLTIDAVTAERIAKSKETD